MKILARVALAISIISNPIIFVLCRCCIVLSMIVFIVVVDVFVVIAVVLVSVVLVVIVIVVYPKNLPLVKNAAKRSRQHARIQQRLSSNERTHMRGDAPTI